MIKESKLKNKSRNIFKKYRNNKNNLRHKKTVKNGVKMQKGGEVKALTDNDYDKFSVSKYINQDIDWGLCPGQVPTPNCSIL